jgi:hypothetical protein
VHRHGCRHREQLPDADGLGAEGVFGVGVDVERPDDLLGQQQR